jgi:hypothetical protein
MGPEALYVHLGRLIEVMPDLKKGSFSEHQVWLGKAYALVDASRQFTDAAALKRAVGELQQAASGSGALQQFKRDTAAQTIATILHRVLAVVELKAPTTAQGAFIPAGSAFDAMAAVAKVLRTARRDVLMIDPYFDERVLTDFAPLATEGVNIRLLSDESSVYATLAPATTRWTAQYGSRRPLEVRLSPRRELHDRLVIIDGGEVWLLTQSFKDLAARSPATIIRVEGESGSLKIAAYEAKWQAATLI